jgi:hypothetical protein
MHTSQGYRHAAVLWHGKQVVIWWRMPNVSCNKTPLLSRLGKQAEMTCVLIRSSNRSLQNCGFPLFSRCESVKCPDGNFVQMVLSTRLV